MKVFFILLTFALGTLYFKVGNAYECPVFLKKLSPNFFNLKSTAPLDFERGFVKEEISKSGLVSFIDKLSQCYYESSGSQVLSIQLGIFGQAPKYQSISGNLLKQKNPSDYKKIDQTVYFDLASLTKTITGLSFLHSLDPSLYDPQTPISRFIELLGREPNSSHQKITLEHLMRHSSGLSDWKSSGSEKGARALIFTKPDDSIWFEPSTVEKNRLELFKHRIVTSLGSFRYQDINFILLSEFFKASSQKDYRSYLEDIYFPLLGIKDYYLPSNTQDDFRKSLKVIHMNKATLGDKKDFLAWSKQGQCPKCLQHLDTYRLWPLEPDQTVQDFWFEGQWLVYPQGLVHDPWAQALGGLSGHAGVYMSSYDFYKVLDDFYLCYKEDQGKSLNQKIAHKLLTKDQNGRGMIFDFSSDYAAAIKPEEVPKNSFGHTAFTGNSYWISPDDGKYALVFHHYRDIGDKYARRRLRVLRRLITYISWRYQ